MNLWMKYSVINQILNDVEDEIEVLRRRMNQEEDIPMWKQTDGRYLTHFSTKKTWLSIRQSQPACQ